MPKTPQTTAARRRVIAKRVVEGANGPQIARELGITKQAVSSALHQPETQALVKAWMEPHHGDVRSLIPLAIETVRESMAKGEATRDKLNAVRTLDKVLGWAEGRTGDVSNAPAAPRHAGSLEEYLVLYRRLAIGPQAPPDDGAA